MQRFLLASHGSLGALAAENVALAACKPKDEVHHLYVIPSWWADMTGDDWLNNGISRDRFKKHLEGELRKESDETIARIKHECEKSNVKYQLHFVVGDSEESLREFVNKGNYQNVFLGERRPRNVSGPNDRMLTRQNRSLLAKKITIIPHPHG